MEKKFKASYKSKKLGKVVSILRIKRYDWDNQLWLDIQSTDEENASHDGSFIVNKKIANKLSKYFKDLSKELK